MLSHLQFLALYYFTLSSLTCVQFPPRFLLLYLNVGLLVAMIFMFSITCTHDMDFVFLPIPRLD